MRYKKNPSDEDVERALEEERDRLTTPPRHTKESYYAELVRQGYSEQQAWEIATSYYG
jgi:hypothetical protein